MIELIKLYWRTYRVQVAIVVAIIIFSARMLLPLLNPEPYDFLHTLLFSALTIVLYLIMALIFMTGYHLYKNHQLYSNTGYKAKTPDIFTIDNFLCVFTIYSTFAFTLGVVAENILNIT